MILSGPKMTPHHPTIINFLVIAFVVFMLVRSLNKMKKAEEAAPAPALAGPTQEELLADILAALEK